jgi:hypothetical protein
MPKVVIHREGGQKIEISDLTFEQVKELAGVNGYAPKPTTTPLPPRRRATSSGTIVAASGPDVHGFTANITDRARLFIAALREHPDGVDSDAMTGFLQLNDPKQIGGFTGGGLSKFAKKYGIRMEDIYKTEIKYPDGKRTLVFYAGKLIKNGTL